MKAQDIENEFRSKYKFVYVWEDSPKTIYKRHKHEGKSSIYILQGEVKMTFENNESILLRKGELLEVPQNIFHTAIVGQDGCTFLVGQEKEDNEIFE